MCVWHRDLVFLIVWQMTWNGSSDASWSRCGWIEASGTGRERIGPSRTASRTIASPSSRGGSESPTSCERRRTCTCSHRAEASSTLQFRRDRYLVGHRRSGGSDFRIQITLSSCFQVSMRECYLPLLRIPRRVATPIHRCLRGNHAFFQRSSPIAAKTGRRKRRRTTRTRFPAETRRESERPPHL